MGKGVPLPILLGGPSGAGKSSLGAYVQGKGWLYFEADLPRPRDGIDDLGLRIPWNRFLENCDPGPLAVELERRRSGAEARRVMLTIPSFAPSIAILRPTEGILLSRLLAGPRNACRESFIARELSRDPRETRRGLEAHWNGNNTGIMAALAAPAYAQYKIEAIDNAGRYVDREILAQRLLELSRPVDTDRNSTVPGPGQR
jgi:hypothetical protein